MPGKEFKIGNGMLKRWQEANEKEIIKNLPTNIPDNIEEFYKLAGPFTDTSEGNIGKPVKHLTSYQIEAWNDRKFAKYRLYLKSQKIGMTTYFLLEDLYVALTYGRGMEILLVAQTKEKAQQHLRVLRHYIRNSPTYKDYLIEQRVGGRSGKKGDEELLQDEKSKTDVLYLRNPLEGKKGEMGEPTKIIALGITSAGSLISFMRVIHIHMSDVTIAQQTDEHAQLAFGGLFSRLANTNGTMVIECPPRGPSGPVWDIVDRAPELKKDGYLVELTDDPVDIKKLGFRVRRLTYKVGIKAGIITEEFIEQERGKQGVRFAMYYETDFYSSANTWFPKEYGIRDWSSTIPSYEKLNTDIMAKAHRLVTGVITGKRPNLDGEIGGYADASDIAKFVKQKAVTTGNEAEEKPDSIDMKGNPVKPPKRLPSGYAGQMLNPKTKRQIDPEKQEKILKKQNEETAKEMQRIQEETDRELDELRKTRDKRRRQYGIE